MFCALVMAGVYEIRKKCECNWKVKVRQWLYTLRYEILELPLCVENFFFLSEEQISNPDKVFSHFQTKQTRELSFFERYVFLVSPSS